MKKEQPNVFAVLVTYNPIIEDVKRSVVSLLEQVKFLVVVDNTGDKVLTAVMLGELIDLRDHPFFVACQYHPEFLSKPYAPHPLFRGFIAACLASSE